VLPEKGIRPIYIYGNLPTEIPVDKVLTRDEDLDELGLGEPPTRAGQPVF